MRKKEEAEKSGGRLFAENKGQRNEMFIFFEFFFSFLIFSATRGQSFLSVLVFFVHGFFAMDKLRR